MEAAWLTAALMRCRQDRPLPKVERFLSRGRDRAQSPEQMKAMAMALTRAFGGVVKTASAGS